MLGMIKAMLPYVSCCRWVHMHTILQRSVKREAKIARLESNAVILKENTAKLETALETETASRERAEQNLQVQLEAVGKLTEKNTEMQAEMDDYLSIFKRHDLTN